MAYSKSIVAYLICELLVAVVAIIGNSFVAIVFLRNRRLRTPTNLYVFSLAITDLVTSGVATPIYVHSMLTQKPRDFHTCLYVNTLILTFCTVSIFHLLAVSFDRYMAVVWRRKPTSHERGMRHAAIWVGLAWASGVLIGCLPLMGWHGGQPAPTVAPKCEFMKVIRMSYLIFLFYATIVTPTIIMLFFYISIYRAVKTDRGRMASVHFSLDTRMSKRVTEGNEQGETSSRQDQRKKFSSTSNSPESQGNQTRRIIFSLVLVIVCFLISWYPLSIMNVIAYYCTDCKMEPWWFYGPIVLSHFSSAINPFIYAGTMPGYKEAFLEVLSCSKSNTTEIETAETEQRRDSNSVSNQEEVSDEDEFEMDDRHFGYQH